MANPTKTTLAKQHIEKIFSKLPTGKALEDYLQTYPVDKLDVIYATLIRLIEVFSSAYANGSYDPNPLYSDHHPLGVDAGDYGQSFFDKVMYKQDANGHLHPSAAGITMGVGFGTLALTAGIGRSIYDKAHKNNLKSRKRLKTMMARHLTEDEMTSYSKAEEDAEALIEAHKKTLAAHMDQLRHIQTLSLDELTQIKIKAEAGRNQLKQAIAAQKTSNKIEIAINAATDAFNTAQNNPYQISVENGLHQIKRVKGSIFNKSTRTENKPTKSLKETVFSVISKLDTHRYINRLAYPFTWAVNQSMWYWLAWFTALIIVGPIALSAPPVMLGLAITVAIIGGGLSLWQAKNRYAAHNKHVDLREKIVDVLQNRNTVMDAAFKKDILTMRDYYKNQPAYQRLTTDDKRAAFLFRKYQKYDAADKARMEATLKTWQSKTFMDFEHQQNLEKIENIRNDSTLKDKHVLEAQINAMPDDKTKDVGNYLFSTTRKSRFARHLYVATQVMAAISFGIVIPFFITQLLVGFVAGGAILALHAGVAINLVTVGGITGALNSSLVSTVWGALWGAKNGIVTFINQRGAKLSYADRVETLLKTKVNGETNEARFNRLQHGFDKKMAYLKANYHDAYKAMKKTLVGSKYWGATNHHYHEKQREKATPWTRVKQTLNRGFEVFGGSQTGILVTRVLFLSGCVFAGVLAVAATVAISGATFGLAPILFTVMAGVAGGLLGANRLLKYHLRSRQEHRKNFLNTFDDRVKFLEQKNEELDKLLGIEKPVAPNEAPHDDPAVVDDIAVEENPQHDQAQEQPMDPALGTVAASSAHDSAPTNKASMATTTEAVAVLKMNADADSPGRKERVRATKDTEAPMIAKNPHLLFANLSSCLNESALEQQCAVHAAPAV